MLLASWGHPVRIHTKPAGDQRLGVSLPPSCAKLFNAIGVSDAVERAGGVRSTGNTVWWGGAEARVERFADGERGWQVDLGQLSRVLLECAIAKGVDVDGSGASDSPAGSAITLDCTGRAGVIARAKRVRRYQKSPRTIALVGEWERSDAWPVPDQSHTLIESYVDGWMWSVPVGGVRHVAAMVDPQRTNLAHGGSSEVYLGEIGKTRQFKKLTAGATLRGGARGWDASQYDATSYAGDGWLLVGDAASFVDPLSSAGVKKALASAWLAAIAAHTCLTSPSMAAHARSFFDAREREIAADLFGEQKRFLAAAATGHHHVFWDERADDTPQLADDRALVMKAFVTLRAADRLSMTVGPGVSIEVRPCIRGNQIVLEPHVIGKQLGGTRYIRNVDVVAILELAPAATSVPGLYEAYLQRVGPTPLDGFLAALATAVSRRWLVAK
jgi:flavin-dependent dehydrogenase